MNQFVLTVSAGKRLIAKGIAAHPSVKAAMQSGTLAIIAGTTNSYVVQEVFKSAGIADGFSPKGFYRGHTFAPFFDPTSVKARFSADVILVKGAWQRGKQIQDVVNDMQAGDVILKGANALNVARRRAAVQIGHPQGGTAGVSLPAVVGRRVQMIVPVGLEKRVEGDLDDIASAVNAPASEGPRLLVLPGQAFCELDAIELLTGAKVQLVAAGGVCGAEGAVWVGVSGSPDQLSAARDMIASVAGELPFEA